MQSSILGDALRAVARRENFKAVEALRQRELVGLDEEAALLRTELPKDMRKVKDIEVKTLTGHTVKINNVYPHDPVLTIAVQVQAAGCGAVDNQKLMFNNERIPMQATLASVGINDKATLHCSLRLGATYRAEDADLLGYTELESQAIGMIEYEIKLAKKAIALMRPLAEKAQKDYAAVGHAVVLGSGSDSGVVTFRFSALAPSSASASSAASSASASASGYSSASASASSSGASEPEKKEEKKEEKKVARKPRSEASVVAGQAAVRRSSRLERKRPVNYSEGRRSVRARKN